MRKIKIAAGVGAGIAGALLIFAIICSVIYTPTYMARYFLWRTSDIRDYEKFPLHEMKNAPPPFMFASHPQENEVRVLFGKARYRWEGKFREVGDLDGFLSKTGTTAFLVIKDDSILYEKYFNGYKRDSVNTSFSMAKSFTSALVGAAIGDGSIQSVEDPIIKYIPELKGKGLDGVTIRNLLMMASGIRYRESKLGDIDFPWGSDPLTYYFPDLRKAALAVRREEGPGLHFHYNNYHPLLLGMILERATGKSVAAYLEEKIWMPLGMEFPGSWSIDSKQSNFEKMESGINARSIDFAKLGRLFLKKGKWNDKQIISENWVTESTRPPSNVPAHYYARYPQWPFFTSDGGYYKYMWWGYSKDGGYDFYADGHLGQFIYVCPQKNLIIVRNGMRLGQVDWWPEIFRDVSERI
jgi:CubicO group peptidase (beta-lactamase class C family)